MKTGTGNLTKRWNVLCNRCTGWDIPSGTKTQAAATLRESGWILIGYKWICPSCIRLTEQDYQKTS